MRSAAASVARAGALALLLAARPGLAEPEASEAEIAALLRGMASARGVEAAFVERKTLALLEAPLESRGRLFFEPPDRFARFTHRPLRTALVVDGASVSFRQEGEERLDLSGDPTARQFVENFLVLFAGDAGRLRRLYAATLSTDGPSWELTLVPRRRPLSSFLSRVELRGEDRELREMVLREVDGDVTVTSLSELRVDRPFSAEERARLFERGLPLDGATGAP